MFEKVNPAHPDKIADRIAGALVDIAYAKAENPRVAVEVLIGHGLCHIVAESSVNLNTPEAEAAVYRIAGPNIFVDIDCHPQDAILAANQSDEIRCGDNGIFRGVPLTAEQLELKKIALEIYDRYHADGKYILDGDKLVICQSNANRDFLALHYPFAIVNPLGNWTGGTDVDAGATNRKLGSDMGDAVTGGGLHGKDLSKADVSVNIYAHLKAQSTGEPVAISCAIGDTVVDGHPYREIVATARAYIAKRGGFERFAEWGLI